MVPDALLVAADNALRTLSGSSQAARPCPKPAGQGPATALTATERRLAGALMRVNHVGEVCAQALYQAQALSTRDPTLKAHFGHAARDETDHLAWTQARLRELDARVSLLNPLWYAGAFGIGLLAAARAMPSAWGSWSRPSARWSSTSKATWTACQPPTKPRAQSCFR